MWATRRPAITLLADDLDVSALVTWITAIPLTDWPAGDLTQLRPAMVTRQDWHGFAGRTDALVAQLLYRMGTSVEAIGVRKATSRWLSVVMPGHVIEPHRDGAEPGWIRRVHVPLTTNPNAIVTAGGKPYHLAVGNAYLFDKTALHAVANAGPTPRIHFMFDIIGGTS